MWSVVRIRKWKLDFCIYCIINLAVKVNNFMIL